MGRTIDLTGQRFGKLTVVGFAGRTKAYAAKWECVCDCGNHKIVRGDHLARGAISSCGCIVRKQDGLHNSKLYYAWRNMVRRCHDPGDKRYDGYGSRGITVCEQWRNDFMEFYKWSLANGYKEGLSIDRIDNDGPYSPENCRWVTAKQNCNNRRTNHNIEYNGMLKTISEWADYFHIEYDLFYGRLYNEDFSIARYEEKYGL